MSGTSQFTALLPARIGLIAGIALMMSGKWFVRWETDYGIPSAWHEVRMGDGANILVFLVIPAIGAATGSWIGWMCRKTRPGRPQRLASWILFALSFAAWLWLTLKNASRIEYPAFFLSLALFLRAVTIQCRSTKQPCEPANQDNQNTHSFP